MHFTHLQAALGSSLADTWIPLTCSPVVQDLETLSDQQRSSRDQDDVESEAMERDGGGGGGGGGGESDPGGVGGTFGWEAFTLNYKVTWQKEASSHFMMFWRCFDCF